MVEKPGRLLWLRIIGYMFIPVLVFPVFSLVTYPLKPHCSLGQGIYGCTPICEVVSYFEDGRPASYKVTPCFHNLNPNTLQKFIYEKSSVFYPALLILTTGLFLWLTRINRLNVIPKIALVPIYFLKENRHNRNSPVRLLVLILLIFPLAVEWAVGYVIVAGTLLGKANLLE